MVLYWRKGTAQLREMPNVFEALSEYGFLTTPIFGGGAKRNTQERERWASGCLVVALRPRVAASYGRKEVTLLEMERAGFAGFPVDTLPIEQDHLAEGEGAVITFQ